MGWGDCGTDSRGRRIGYVFRGKCDHRGCKERIYRGIASACGGMHGTSEGCEGYFCDKHLYFVEDPFDWVGEGVAVLCETCKNEHNERLIEDLMEERKEIKHKDEALKRGVFDLNALADQWKVSGHMDTLGFATSFRRARERLEAALSPAPSNPPSQLTNSPTDQPQE